MARAGQISKSQRASWAPARSRGLAQSPLLLGALVLLAALVPYWGTLDFELVWDDPFVIGSHLDFRGWSDLGRIWNTPFDLFLKDETQARTYFRPMTLYTLALDRALWREDPRGYHAQNVAWYAAACLFLWLLAVEVSGRPLAATAGAILFALHPTHPESVAFVSGRTDLIAGTSLFAALWSAVRLGPNIRGAWLKLLPAALILLPGMLAKEVAVFGAPLLPLALWLGDRRLSRADLARATVPILAVVVLYLVARSAALGPSSLPAIAPVVGAVPQILTSVAVVARYVPLLAFPVALSARHDVPPTTTPDALFLAGLLVTGGGLAGLVAALRQRSWWSLPLALLAATLLPVCYVRLLSGAIVAERFLFAPSGAIALAIALLPGALGGARAGIARAGRARDASPFFLAAAAAGGIWFLTLLLPRVSIWRNEGTLFASMLRDSPNSPHVHGIVGGYYYRQRDLERAARHYRRSFELYPQSGEMLLNLVAAEDEMGRIDSAFVHARRLIELQPAYGPAWYALGNLYVRIDDPDSAQWAYEQALRFAPTLAQAENNLGAVLERMGKDEEAIAHYRRAGEIQPGYPEAARNLERLLAQRASRPAGSAQSSPKPSPGGAR